MLGVGPRTTTTRASAADVVGSTTRPPPNRHILRFLSMEALALAVAVRCGAKRRLSARQSSNHMASIPLLCRMMADGRRLTDGTVQINITYFFFDRSLLGFGQDIPRCAPPEACGCCVHYCSSAHRPRNTAMFLQRWPLAPPRGLGSGTGSGVPGRRCRPNPASNIPRNEAPRSGRYTILELRFGLNNHTSETWESIDPKSYNSVQGKIQCSSGFVILSLKHDDIVVTLATSLLVA
jgi:hypothetical protein